MVVLASKDGCSPFPDALVQAVTQLAVHQADLTCQWLSLAGYAPGPLNVPEAFLFELAAVLQIGEWERHDLIAYLDVELPSSRQAAVELAARTVRGLEEFHGPNATRLSMRVNTIWIERFVWAGPTMLQADIVFGTCDEDALVEQFADFLWQHHLELQKLTVTETNDER